MRTIVDIARELDEERRKTCLLKARLADRDTRIAQLSAELADARLAAGYTRPPTPRTVDLRATIGVLADLLEGRIPADRVPPWVPVEPGTTIKAGTHYRIEWDDASAGGASATERHSSFDFTPCPTDPGRYSIDPRTVPAEPEDPRVAVVAHALSDILDDNGVTTCDWTAEAHDILARLDAARADA